MILVVIFWALLWLMSAWEGGALGNWVPVLVISVVSFVVLSIGYSEWKWADEELKRGRELKRMTRKMIEQANKEMYLRSVR